MKLFVVLASFVIATDAFTVIPHTSSYSTSYLSTAAVEIKEERLTKEAAELLDVLATRGAVADDKPLIVAQVAPAAR